MLPANFLRVARRLAYDNKKNHKKTIRRESLYFSLSLSISLARFIAKKKKLFLLERNAQLRTTISERRTGRVREASMNFQNYGAIFTYEKISASMWVDIEYNIVVY